MSSSQLDRIVKGAPPPHVSPDQVASAARKSSTSSTHSITAPHAPPSDPISHLPSSPPQIYLNLLILEASLRAQYISLRVRLRLHIILLGALALWTLFFTYLLFLRPREDGKGTGGSVYWVVDATEKMGFVGGAVTWGLVWGTGMWDRGVRWPRKWVGTTNRGLRGFNLKVVVMRGPWWKEAFGYLNILDPLGWWAGTKGMRYELLPRDVERLPTADKERIRRLEESRRDGWIEEDVAPGGNVIKLLLLPKPFSPDFREEWDTFRTSYWDKENERRVELRKLVKARDRELAKREGGYLWWAGWRGWRNVWGIRKMEAQQHQAATKHVREKTSTTHLKRERRRDQPTALRDSTAGDSRSSSRSSTPTPSPPLEADGAMLRHASLQGSRRTSSNQPLARKKRVSSGGGGSPAVAVPSSGSGSSRPSSRASDDSASPSPIAPQQQLSSQQAHYGRTVTKRASNLSIGSVSSDGEIKEETPPSDVEIKREDEG